MSRASKTKENERKSSTPKRLAVHPLDVSNYSLGRALDDINLTLREILKKTWPRESNHFLDREIATYLNSRKIDSRAINKCWLYPDTEDKKSELKEYFFYARLHYLSAQENKAEGNLDAAAINVAFTASFMSFLQGYVRGKYVHEMRQERAKQGANSKILNEYQLRKKFLILLTICRPKGGWNNERHAIKSILESEELKMFLSESNSNISQKKLDDLFSEEIISPDIQKVYKKLKK